MQSGQPSLPDNRSPSQVEQSITPGALSALLVCMPVTGRLLAINSQGIPLVQYQDIQGSVQTDARFTVALQPCHIGSEVVLLLKPSAHQKATRDLPIIIGIIQSALNELMATNNNMTSQVNNDTTVSIDRPKTEPITAQVDGQSVTITAQNSITLKCGDARITLNKDGKIKIKGNYVISQAKKANRIRGGSVELN